MQTCQLILKMSVYRAQIQTREQTVQQELHKPLTKTEEEVNSFSISENQTRGTLKCEGLCKLLARIKRKILITEMLQRLHQSTLK